MKLPVGVRLGTLVLLGSAALSYAAVKSKPEMISAASAKFEQVIPGVKKAALWGDDKKGPYGAFTRFDPGHKNPLHTHSSDIHMVVLEGAYIFTGQDGKTTRVGPNSYFTVPAGVPHVSEGDPSKGALFLESSEGPFDLKPVEQGVGGSGHKKDAGH